MACLWKVPRGQLMASYRIFWGKNFLPVDVPVPWLLVGRQQQVWYSRGIDDDCARYYR